MKIETAAMKWHSARQRRLEARRCLRLAKLGAWPPLSELAALEEVRSDAKRIETRALREMAKACTKAKEVFVEDGRLTPRLPVAAVIDI